MGRTTRSPYLQFQEHVEKDTDQFEIGRALRKNPKNFIVIQSEKVPEGTNRLDWTIFVSGNPPGFFTD